MCVCDNDVCGDVITGTITTRRSLDHELEHVCHLVVSVSAPSPSASASASSLPSNTTNVTVYVTDVNDNSPVFDFPSPSNDTVYVGNHLQQG